MSRTTRTVLLVLPAVVVVLATLAVGVISLIEAVRWSGEPFVGFLYYSNGRVSPIQRTSWIGMANGVGPSDVVRAVDGVPATDEVAVRAHLRTKRVGEAVTLTIDRKGGARVVTVPLTAFSASDIVVTVVLPIAIGFFMLVIGTVVFFLSPPSAARHIQLYLLVVVSAFFFVTFNVNSSFTFDRVWLFYPAFGAFSVHLFAVFPARIGGAAGRFVPLCMYVAATTLIVLRQVFLDDPVVSDGLTTGTTAYLTCVFVVDVAFLAINWRRTESELARTKVKLLLVALLFTISAGLVWAYVSRVRPEWITVDRVMILAAIFPVMLGYAVVKHNLFDIDRVVRLSASYVLATGVVVVVYLGAVATLSILSQPFLEPFDPTIAAILSTLVVAAMFHPLRVRLQRVIDRLFFRDRVDARKTLTELSKALSRVSDIDSLTRLIEKEMPRALHASSIAVFLGAGDESALTHYASATREKRWPPIPREGALVEADRRVAGGRVVPLIAHGVLVGIVSLGPKRGTSEYSAAEIELLQSLAVPLALAADNALLYAARARSERLAAVGQVASLIVHEVKNPLGIIKVSAGTLKKRFAQHESGFELATLIEQEVTRMNRTVQQILAFARPQSVEPVPCSLSRVVERACKMIEVECEPDGIRLERTRPDDEVVVHGDDESLLQAFLNLLLNAKEALVEGKSQRTAEAPDATIRVAVQVSRGNARVAVSDNGPGIPEENVAKLFQPFFSTKRGGTGLGLAIVKQIVEQHEGTISVESTVGAGTTFSVSMPCETAMATLPVTRNTHGASTS